MKPVFDRPFLSEALTGEDSGLQDINTDDISSWLEDALRSGREALQEAHGALLSDLRKKLNQRSPLRWAACEHPAGPENVDVKLMDIIPPVEVEDRSDAGSEPNTPPKRRSRLDRLPEDKLLLEMQRLHELNGQNFSKLVDNFAAGFTGKQSLADWVRSPIFDGIAACMIILNATMLGLEIEVYAYQPGGSVAIEVCLDILNVYFLIELIARISVQRANFLKDADSRFWNIFETLLAILSCIELLAKATAGSTSSNVYGLKTLKMLRIIRVFRMFRFLRGLTELASMVLDSIRSLMFAMILLALVLYVFAIVISSQLSDYLQRQVDVSQPQFWMNLENHSDADIAMLYKSFGSLVRTAYTLLQTIMQGVSWHLVSDPLIAKDFFIPCGCYLFYLAFTNLATLNIINGIFVDNAFHFAQNQRNLAILKELDRKEAYTKKLVEFFNAIDEDGSGEISLDEFAIVLDDPTLAAYFRVLEFDVDDAQRFISLLDLDDSGSLNIEEFIAGCTKFKGGAQELTVHTLLKEVKVLRKDLLQCLRVSSSPETSRKAASLHDNGAAARRRKAQTVNPK